MPHRRADMGSQQPSQTPWQMLDMDHGANALRPSLFTLPGADLNPIKQWSNTHTHTAFAPAWPKACISLLLASILLFLLHQLNNLLAHSHFLSESVPPNRFHTFCALSLSLLFLCPFCHFMEMIVEKTGNEHGNGNKKCCEQDSKIYLPQEHIC